MNRLFKYSTVLLLAIVSIFQVGCEKSDISPAKQDVAFVKYYGHVANQEASDVQRTTDGGYIMLGTTNSYDQDGERDIFLIKTDSLGNEEWSRTFGERTTTTGISFDETGAKLIILPGDAGYVISGNKRYKQNGNTIATKIVLYQLDLVGAIVAGPVTLRTDCISLNCTDEISDIKIDTIGGTVTYALTGYTTNVFPGKPGGPFATDGTDILAMRLDENFNSLWQAGVLAYGFAGNDYGTSLHVVSDGYIVVGTDQQIKNGLKDQIRIVKYRKTSGATILTRELTDATAEERLGGGHSVLDEINQEIVILAHVTEGVNNSPNGGNAGNLLVLKVGYDFIPKGGFTQYGSKRGNMPSLGTYSYTNLTSASISLLPDDKGYICSFTNTIIDGQDSDIGILRIDNDLNVMEGFPYTFGYQNKIRLDGTLEQAGSVIPALTAIEGTAQVRLEGYVFTGTFGLGTNRMVGMIKVNEKGNFSPD
jgi:hypothetical protein